MGKDTAFRIFGVRSYLLNKKIDLDMQDQIRLAIIFIKRVNDHTFFFPEIMQNSEKAENFKDIDFKILYKFVDAIIEKVEQNNVYFEHLKSSQLFKYNDIYFNELTVQMLRKIKS